MFLLHKTRSVIWILSLALLVGGLTTPHLLAKSSSKSVSNKYKNSGGGSVSTTQPTSNQPAQVPIPVLTPPPADNPAVDADNAAIKDSVSNVQAAQQARDQIVSQLQTAFQQTQPWLDAQAALDKAKADLAAAQKAVRDNMTAADPDYAAAKSAKDSADAALAAAKDSSDTNPDDIPPLAENVMRADGALGIIETTAFAQDPACQTAQDNISTAHRALAQLLADFKTNLAQNPDYTDAQKKVDDANQQLSDARAKLASDSGHSASSSATPASGSKSIFGN